MDEVNYDALIALLPEKYRAAVLAALQLAGALLAGLSVLVPLIERLVRALPGKTADVYLARIQRARSVLSLFPRIIVPRLSQAPTMPAPVGMQAPNEKLQIQINWPTPAEKAAAEHEHEPAPVDESTVIIPKSPRAPAP